MPGPVSYESVLILDMSQAPWDNRSQGPRKENMYTSGPKITDTDFTRQKTLTTKHMHIERLEAIYFLIVNVPAVHGLPRTPACWLVASES